MRRQCIVLVLCLAWLNTSAKTLNEPLPNITELKTLSKKRFYGACDASGAVALSNRLFAVADDEDNVIRVYDAETGGAPLFQYELSYTNELKLDTDHQGRPQPAPLDEMDIEAATSLNGKAYWITSHGRDKKGRKAPARLRFFATQIELEGYGLSLNSEAVDNLLAALINAPSLKPFDLAQAARKPPKALGGLNIEGMTATPQNTLMIGFRSPTPESKALLVNLLNPTEVLAGVPAEFSLPRLLDLGERGIRGLSFWRDQYLVAAGDTGNAYQPAVYSWMGDDAPAQKINIAWPTAFNPEAFFTPDDRDEFMILSDDGSYRLSSERCKKLDDINEKFFRGIWLTPNKQRD